MRLIDADELMEKAGRYKFAVREDIYELIDRAPTIDPVRRGRWKAWDLTWGRSIYYCTVCENAEEVPTVMGKPSYNYCPNCGARMED